MLHYIIEFCTSDLMKSVGSYQANQLIGREGIDAKMWPVMLLKLDAWLFLLLLSQQKSVYAEGGGGII